MARRASQRRADTFVNRYRGRLTSGAAGAVAYESFNTGMNIGQLNPMKWIITGFQIEPTDAGYATMLAQPTVSCWSEWQLVIGTVTDFVDEDNGLLVLSMGWSVHVLTSGASIMEWPLTAKLPGPLPIFANTLTVVEDHLNNAHLNIVEWKYEIDYFLAPVVGMEASELLAAQGQV